LYAFYVVAEKLHKTISEVMEMEEIEFKGWIAYLDLKSDKINAKHHR
jgi:hypothetical protein